MKRSYLSFIVLMFFCAFLSSCKQSNLDSNEYIEWIENKENGLLAEYSSGSLVFRAQYKPAEYLLIKENKITVSTEADFLKSKDEVDNLYHFNFNISSNDTQKDILKKDIKDEQSFMERIQYFSYDAQNDFKLIRGSDTLNCVLYHFERSYGISPYNTIVLAFEKNSTDKKVSADNFILIYKDQAFGQGIIAFKIKSSDINNIPMLKIESIKDKLSFQKEYIDH